MKTIWQTTKLHNIVLYEQGHRFKEVVAFRIVSNESIRATGLQKHSQRVKKPDNVVQPLCATRNGSCTTIERCNHVFFCTVRMVTVWITPQARSRYLPISMKKHRKNPCSIKLMINDSMNYKRITIFAKDTQNDMKRFIGHTILILLAEIFLFCPITMSQNNPYKINDQLYSYYQKCNSAIRKPEVLLMADTLFHMAKKKET